MSWDISSALLAVFAMGAVTVACRATPFILFRSGTMPEVLRYLQRYMPPMIMMALVINSFKAVDFSGAPWGLNYIGPGIVVAILHVWKRNALLSIVCGTALHIALLRLS